MLERSLALDRWIGTVLDQEAPRSKSLVVTVFGDALAPRGGAVWLGGLIRLLEPFGVNDRLARTSLFRLTEDGWFEPRREGRRSLYALTPAGRRRIEHASRRIYRAPAEHWDGRWTIVLLPRACGAEARDGLRRELRWEGFGLIAPGVLARPAVDADTLAEILQGRGLQQSVFAMSARDLDGVAARPTGDLIEQCWNLADLAGHYRRFIERVRPLAPLLAAAGAVEPQQAFHVRILLIHLYRRIALDDPQIPSGLLPADWPGRAAYTLCRDLYARVLPAAERHLDGMLEGPHGSLPRPGAELHERFGGLAAS